MSNADFKIVRLPVQAALLLSFVPSGGGGGGGGVGVYSMRGLCREREARK